MSDRSAGRAAGPAGTLVWQAGRYGREVLGAGTFVIVADPADAAIRVYRACGFADAESQFSFERPSLTSLSSVTTAVTSSAGVMSNAKLSALVPAGAAGTRDLLVRAPLDRNRRARRRRLVDGGFGAATRNGIPAPWAARARL